MEGAIAAGSVLGGIILALVAFGLGRWSTAYEREDLREERDLAIEDLERDRAESLMRAHGGRADMERERRLADAHAAGDLDSVVRELAVDGAEAPPVEPSGEAVHG